MKLTYLTFCETCNITEEQHICKTMKKKILESTIGYDMTINTYYIVIEENEKTALVQEIGKKVFNDEGRGSGTSIADESIRKGKIFRAFKRDRGEKVYYVSKYIDGRYADEWDGKPSYYNTWD